MKRILFTGGGGAGSEAIYRLLSNKYEVYFADADVKTISSSIPERFRCQILFANNQNFVQNLNELCSSLNIDLVIPSVDEELLEITKLNTQVMLPDYDYVKIMLDKLETAKIISKAGIDAPKTILVSDFLEGVSFSFPCIAKPRNGRGSRDVNVLKSSEQVSAYLSLTGRLPKDIVLQELFVGQEYTVLMSADSDKNLHKIVPVLVEIKKGITLRAEVVNNNTVITACRAIHESIPTKGCYNIQLILTNKKRVIPFEINPRVSTTFCLALASGVDPIAVFNGEENNKLEFIGSKLQRYWSNYLY